MNWIDFTKEIPTVEENLIVWDALKGGAITALWSGAKYGFLDTSTLQPLEWDHISHWAHIPQTPPTQ